VTTLQCNPGVPSNCVRSMNYYVQFPAGPIAPLARSTSPPYSVTWNTANGAYPDGEYGLSCAIETPQSEGTGAVISVKVRNNSFNPSRENDEHRGLQWTSVLDIPGSKGQVVWNGAEAHYMEGQALTSRSQATTGDTTYRVEATVVHAVPRPGTWSFRFDRALRPGSLQAVAGNVVRVTGDTIVFRVTGTPGERIVFKLETR
jgi:hypothetical protein